MTLTFPKHEKLKSRKAIKQLFEEGKAVTKYPVKLLYVPAANQEHTQAGFAVPKRNFKSAVTRNQIKRIMREGYRLQKEAFLAEKDKKFSLLFIYIGKETLPYKTIEKAIKGTLKKCIL